MARTEGIFRQNQAVRRAQALARSGKYLTIERVEDALRSSGEIAGLESHFSDARFRHQLQCLCDLAAKPRVPRPMPSTQRR